MKSKRGKNGFIAVCILPSVILFIIFMLIPTVNVFKMSMYKWGGFSNNKTFVGMNNFKILFQDDKFYRSFQNSILLIVLVTIVTMAFALIFAAILSREKIKGQNFFRIIFYIPNILSVVVISAIFSAIYDPNQGLLNSILSVFRAKDAAPILWLGNQRLVVYSLVIAMVLHGHVYGKYGRGAGELIRVSESGRRGKDISVFPYYAAADLDKCAYHINIFHYQYYKFKFPVCPGNDQR